MRQKQEFRHEEYAKEYLNYREVGYEFGIRKSALYRWKDSNLIEWSKPPGSSYLFLRSSIQSLLKEHGQGPQREVPEPQPPPVSKRTRKAATLPPGPGFRFLT